MPADRRSSPSVGPTRRGKAAASPVVHSRAQVDASRVHSHVSPVSSSSSSRKRKYKRPPNAFIIFRSNFIKAKEYPAHLTHQSEISSYVAELWNILTDEDRNIFYRQAEVEKKRFEAGQLSEMAEEAGEETTQRPSSDLSSMTESPRLVQDDAVTSGLPTPLALENAVLSVPLVTNTRSALPTVPALKSSAPLGAPATPQSMIAQETSFLRFQSDRISCSNDQRFGGIRYTPHVTHPSASSPNWPSEFFDAGTLSSSDSAAPSDPALSTTHGMISAPTSTNCPLELFDASRFSTFNAAAPSDVALNSGHGMGSTPAAANWPLGLFDTSSLSGFNSTAQFDSGLSSGMELPWETSLGLDIPPPPSFSFEGIYDRNFSAFDV